MNGNFAHCQYLFWQKIIINVYSCIFFPLLKKYKRYNIHTKKQLKKRRLFRTLNSIKYCWQLKLSICYAISVAKLEFVHIFVCKSLGRIIFLINVSTLSTISNYCEYQKFHFKKYFTDEFSTECNCDISFIHHITLCRTILRFLFKTRFCLYIILWGKKWNYIAWIRK